jgi:hypothetical protein
VGWWTHQHWEGTRFTADCQSPAEFRCVSCSIHFFISLFLYFFIYLFIYFNGTFHLIRHLFLYSHSFPSHL